MTATQRIFISAGEASGDLHAAGLARQLLRLHPDLKFFGLGGDNLENLGAEIRYHVRDLAALCFWEVEARFGFFLKVKRDCLDLLRRHRPDLMILTDYPGLNLMLAKEGHRLGIPIVYFILPQVWAWKPRRAYTLGKCCNLLLSILPFEKAFFRRYDVEVEYIGHPLLDLIPPRTSASSVDKNLVVLMPGSRRQELQRNFVPMLQSIKFLTRDLEGLRAVVIKAPSLEKKLYEMAMPKNSRQAELVENDKYKYLAGAQAAIVASGTATLEAALCGTPSVVVYRTSPFTYFLARRFVNVRQIALANLVAGAEIFPELLQKHVNAGNIAEKVRPLLCDPEKSRSIRSKLKDLRKMLEPEGAYERGAKIIKERYLR